MSCEHNTDILYRHPLSQLVSKQSLIYKCSAYRVTLLLMSCLFPPEESKSNIPSCIALFMVSTNSCRLSDLLAARCFTSLCLTVSVCLEIYYGLLEFFFYYKSRVEWVYPNTEVVAKQLNNDLKLTIRLHEVERSWGLNSLQFYYYKFFFFTLFTLFWHCYSVLCC